MRDFSVGSLPAVGLIISYEPKQTLPVRNSVHVCSMVAETDVGTPRSTQANYQRARRCANLASKYGTHSVPTSLFKLASCKKHPLPQGD